MARFVTTRAGFLPVAPDRVMDLVARPATWPTWQPEIESVQGQERVRAGDAVVGRARMLGFHVRARADVALAGPDGLEQDVLVGVRIKVRYVLRPVPGGTELIHRLEVDLPRGLAGRILSLFLRPRLRWMQERGLANLAREVAVDPGGSARVQG